ncbi:vancomycin high temperature exclusion protein [Tessaracoccus sp. OH4464_COT-324]|uniref:SanA/YdcF family protein n=1 Tax=Tessaracoccus sp. OH4464_COT-324 TaxID=2491059 RepID=UPI000F63EE7C|nr:ElyC/SanA/YdcF family protein [Tessaracoccus sp. OH4464_COT-324]RRD47180.1 hypothetical protein EII42_04150 [Tessaracoccus sp. OH4464_COT-324]
MARRRWRWAVGVALLATMPTVLGLTHSLAASWGRYIEPTAVPPGRVGIVLGARADPEQPSASLAFRLDLAVELVRAGRLSRVIVSGDGRPGANNEPRVMRGYLERKGIDPGIITEDPGGYDTYDTCKRAHDVYGLRQAVVLSQDYHIRRTVAICRWVGIDTLGVGDKRLSREWPGYWWKAAIREPFAVIKMEWDLFSGRSPRYEG